jgi:L-cysteate sulfo-lyase
MHARSKDSRQHWRGSGGWGWRICRPPFDPGDVEVVVGHAGPAYSVPHAATVEAIRLGASLDGLVLDPVYLAKSLAGLIAFVCAGRWTSGQDIVFIHTGGAPALFAYTHLFDARS